MREELLARCAALRQNFIGGLLLRRRALRLERQSGELTCVGPPDSRRGRRIARKCAGKARGLAAGPA